MGSVDSEKVIGAILGVILPPVEVLRVKGCTAEFWIDLLLTLLLLWAGGIFYCFHLKSVDVLVNLLTLLISPIGVYIKTKDVVKTLITLILWIFGFIGGIIVGYYFVQ